jgi:type I restriction enzyme S subunit
LVHLSINQTETKYDDIPYLPKGWVWTRLGDICSNVKNKSVEGSALYLEIGNIDIQNKNYLLGEKPTVKGALMSKKDDILISRVRPTRGAITITQEKEINVSSAITVLRTCQEIFPFYIYYFLAWNKSFMNYLGQNSAGTMYPTVKEDFILTYDVPISPLPEQRAIVSKIEPLFSDLDNGMGNFRKAQAQLKLYRQSVLKTACEGKLVPTEAELAQAEGREYEAADVLLARILKERRGKWKKNGRSTKYREPTEPETSGLNDLPEGWVWATIEQLAASEPYSITDGPFGSNLKTSHYTEMGPRVIRLQNIGNGLFNNTYAHISQQHYDSLSKHRVQAGDLVIAALGEHPPRACIIPPSVGPAIVKADCIRLKPDNELALNEFLNCALNSEPTRTRTACVIHGVGRPRLNLGEIKSIMLSLPPLAEQRRIVAEVERRLSVCDKMEAIITESLQKAESLRQSILKKAFEGKLLNEKELEKARAAPDWEPAEKLLERIKAEKTNTQTKNKGKK